MLFGANPVAVKISLTGIGIFTTAGLRFTIAAAVLLTWARLTNKPIAINRKQALQMAGLALIFFLQISIFYYGQSKTTASHGALIGNILPFIVMIMAHYLLPNDTITVRKIAGLMLGFGGIVLLFLDSVSLTADALRGDCILVAAVCIWGCNVIYVKRIISGFHPLQITVYPMIMAIPLYYFAGYLWDGEMIRELNPSVIKGMLYQSVVTASFGFVMWNTLIQKYGATTLHSFIFLMPISGVLLGVTILHEPITPNLLGSIALVAAGLVIINWQKKKVPVENITL
jgi:drug/metabolite transporter (DMT)-like permease